MLSIKTVGGLTFVRAWRLSLSFCVCKSANAPKAAKRERSQALRSVAAGRPRVLVIA